MSLVWTTVALVVLLLPGLAFWVGLQIPEQFTRDSAPSGSPLGQLAGAVFISLAIHGFFFLIQWWPCRHLDSIPCIDLHYTLALLSPGLPGSLTLEQVASNLTQYRVAILIYLVGSAAIGLGLGKFVGGKLITGHFRFLTRHPWALDLTLRSKFGYTYAYVLTRLTHEGRYLVYQGRLEEFGLLANGQFSYIVLSDVRRSYMRLEHYESRVDDIRHAIGAKESQESDKRRTGSRFVIEGPDIANAIFDSYAILVKREEVAELQTLVSRVEDAYALETYALSGTLVPRGEVTTEVDPPNTPRPS